jgi:hypothetical protein
MILLQVIDYTNNTKWRGLSLASPSESITLYHSASLSDETLKSHQNFQWSETPARNRIPALVSHVLRLASCVLRLVSCVLRLASCVLCLASCVSLPSVPASEADIPDLLHALDFINFQNILCCEFFINGHYGYGPRFFFLTSEAE